ncbi:hypothetical protein [Aureliella helgolandensis]|uniref:Uncharacterized protein n=1 Tax=Aureliella helgolandensis TaxID=2527968 RepID=A0A518G2P6_9BACT|nr:hypothetical protein [Aureliella helgolandensis]QDV22873.1 hypothetical protein Q31a_11660 [Aureliella helgolandensis]
MSAIVQETRAVRSHGLPGMDLEICEQCRRSPATRLLSVERPSDAIVRQCDGTPLPRLAQRLMVCEACCRSILWGSSGGFE